MRATIKDIANYAGVSKALVSMYLNNNPLATNPKTRSRIEEAVRKFNYRPSAMARALNRGKNNFIGVVLCEVASIYSGLYIEKLFQEVEKYHCRLLISLTRYDRKREMQCLLDLASQTAGTLYGFYLPPDWKVPEALQNYPILAKGPQKNVNSSIISQTRAGKAAVELLQKSGCRRALSLFSETMHEQEIALYRTLFKEAGIFYRNCDLHEQLAAQRIRKAICDCHADALIARDSRSTIRFLQECDRNGIRNLPKIIYDYTLPHDLILHDSIVGAIVNPFQEYVSLRVKRLMEIIDAPDSPVQTIEIPADFLDVRQLQAYCRRQIADPYYAVLMNECCNPYFKPEAAET